MDNHTLCALDRLTLNRWYTTGRRAAFAGHHPASVWGVNAETTAPACKDAFKRGYDSLDAVEQLTGEPHY